MPPLEAGEPGDSAHAEHLREVLFEEWLAIPVVKGEKERFAGGENYLHHRGL